MEWSYFYQTAGTSFHSNNEPLRSQLQQGEHAAISISQISSVCIYFRIVQCSSATGRLNTCTMLTEHKSFVNKGNTSNFVCITTVACCLTIELARPSYSL
jgi:hypothetical protein